MFTTNRSITSEPLKLYSISTKFGFWGYVMATDTHEAMRLAIPLLPLSPKNADVFGVNEVKDLNLVEI